VLLNSFGPLLLLNFISLGVFMFDYDDVGSRMGTIVTILLALFAFLPSYRYDTVGLDLGLIYFHTGVNFP
jgi:hypothetical protein